MIQKFDFTEIVRKNKVLVLICSIFAIVLGVLCIITPFAAGAVLIWVLIAMIGLFALASIFKFIFPGKGNKRSGVSLAIGIVLALCVALIIVIGCTAEGVEFEGGSLSGLGATTVRLMVVCSIVCGSIAVVENIFLLCNVGRVAKDEKGWLIFKAIIGIAVGVLMLIFPFVMLAVSIVIGGIYAIVMGIALLVLDIKFWKNKAE